jgi:hypothetical protein
MGHGKSLKIYQLFQIDKNISEKSSSVNPKDKAIFF